jgi:hypothetical protein
MNGKSKGTWPINGHVEIIARKQNYGGARGRRKLGNTVVVIMREFSQECT